MGVVAKEEVTGVVARAVVAKVGTKGDAGGSKGGGEGGGGKGEEGVVEKVK